MFDSESDTNKTQAHTHKIAKMNAKLVFLVIFIVNLNIIKCELVKTHTKHNNNAQDSRGLHRSLHRHPAQHDKRYSNQKAIRSKYTIEDLLTTKFPTHISNDIDLDICKSGNFSDIFCSF